VDGHIIKQIIVLGEVYWGRIFLTREKGPGLTQQALRLWMCAIETLMGHIVVELTPNIHGEAKAEDRSYHKGALPNGVVA
jgi:hypothetical protein